VNTSSLKSFAPAVRTQLMEAVGRKLDYVLTADTPDLRQAATQVASLRREAGKNRAALIERVAYTWFNRLAALRFLDAQGWHPFKARVLTPATPEETQPEILKLLRTGSLPAELHPHTDLQRLNDLLDGRLPTAIAGADPQGEAYRGLILAACRLYHTLLPDVFDKLNDESELLLPDDLLTATSVAEGFRTEITDADCLETDASGKSRANVEILGWLYQFYISEKKDAVMARKSAVPTEDIPAVTQLFTPHWIVRYLVENSLGRLWLLNRPNSRLRDHMPYYIEDKDEGGSMKDEANSSDPSSFIIHNSSFLRVNKPEEIRLVDPAVGSGHMLTYAFDLLTLIYEEEGYTPSEIPALILRHNLHGLEICPRAAQLAELALVFKAREKSRRFFQPEHLVRPNITELKDIRFEDGELQAYFKALGRQPSALHPQLAKLLHQFEEAKNFGSLIQPCLTEAEIQSVRSAIQKSTPIIQNSELMVAATHRKVLRVLEQAEALTQRYHVVVANPPYMGSIQLNGLLGRFVSANFSEGSQDLYGAFIMRNLQAVVPKGFVAMITFQNWLSASSFKALREYLINESSVMSLVHNGRGVWGADFGSCAFVLVKEANQVGVFYRLFEKISLVATNEELDAKFLAAVASPTATIRMHEFSKIPSSAIVYWASAQVRSIFEEKKGLGSVAQFKAGMSTGNNPIFQRNWFEVEGRRFAHPSIGTTERNERRWFPCNSGGDFRKWYGNDESVVDWENSGARIKAYGGSAVRNEGYYFREGLTYNKISIGRFAARYRGTGYVFDDTGRCVFPNGEGTTVYTTLAFLCSAVADHFLRMLTPTVSFTSKELEAVPWRNTEGANVGEFGKECISLARADWDNFETSWDFRDQPLLRNYEVGMMNDEGGEKRSDSDFIIHNSSFIIKGTTLEESWNNWKRYCDFAIQRMQELETENNRLFIAAYGLEGELQPEVPEDQITLARADQRKDIAAFLSYAVGVMFGRYSLQVPGLVLADAGGTVEDYWRIVRTKDEGRRMKDEEKQDSDASDPNFILHNSSFILPDEDGILPILDGEWFEDDIVARTREFLRATFGEATLKQNLRFIEDSLGKSLDKYFLTDFYKDHLQTYKKRPIYWLFQSPKKGFSALVYVHRYTKDTVNTLLNKYLRDYLKKLESRIAYLTQEEATATATKDKTAARKEREKLQKALKDCQDWERNTILPVAQARLEIDLDDGVKVNYLKFTGAVQPIAGLAAKED
jgi:hypothetical protein